MTEKPPYCTRRTGTVTFTIIAASPFHKAVYLVVSKEAGEYEIAYDLQCPLCWNKHADDQG
jgi:hypothetical protein